MPPQPVLGCGGIFLTANLVSLNKTKHSKLLVLQKFYTVWACKRNGDSDDVLCRNSQVLETKNIPFTLHDVMLTYLAAHKVVMLKPKYKAKVLDAPQTLLSQVFGAGYKFGQGYIGGNLKLGPNKVFENHCKCCNAATKCRYLINHL